MRDPGRIPPVGSGLHPERGTGPGGTEGHDHR
jgi:hypothetical protein